MSSSAAVPPGENDKAGIRALLQEALQGQLLTWLQTRRWFGDKGRSITGIELIDLHVERVESDRLALAVVRIVFAEGDSSLYFLPLAFPPAPVEPGAGDRGARADATETPWFGPWLLDHMERNDSLGGVWAFASPPTAKAVIESSRAVPATVMRGEQSNTSLRFDDRLIVKLVRKLQPGPNPEEEVLRALATFGFDRVPRFAGAASWHAADGTDYPVALAQAFVPNEGDGWTWMLRRLTAIATGELELDRDAFAPERLLGRRTGEMHVALSRIDDPAFTPTANTPATIAANHRRTHDETEEVIALLQARAAPTSGSTQSDLTQPVLALQAVANRAEGFAAEAGTALIRVHGDYHLGQTLRTPDADWTIVDFEGEPARPVAARREKTSALKDVAGMLRSFAYARGVTERDAPPNLETEMSARIAHWEQGARGAFLAGYREAVTAADSPLVPAQEASFERALAAWELDKTLYEIAYEARNRPDWLALPLRSLLPDLSP